MFHDEIIEAVYKEVLGYIYTDKDTVDESGVSFSSLSLKTEALLNAFIFFIA